MEPVLLLGMMIIGASARVLLFNRAMSGLRTCPPPPEIAGPTNDGRELQAPWSCYPQGKDTHRYVEGSVCRSRCYPAASPDPGTEASISCVAGRSKAHLKWSAKPLHCKETTCNTKEIWPVSNGRWRPERCFMQSTVSKGQNCQLVCDQFYESSSDYLTTVCTSHGWSRSLFEFGCNLQKDYRGQYQKAFATANNPTTLLSDMKVPSYVTKVSPDVTTSVEGQKKEARVPGMPQVSLENQKELMKKFNNLRVTTEDIMWPKSWNDEEDLSEEVVVHPPPEIVDNDMVAEDGEKIQGGFSRVLEGTSLIFIVTGIVLLTMLILALICVCLYICFRRSRKKPEYTLVNEHGRRQLLMDVNNNADTSPNNGFSLSQCPAGYEMTYNPPPVSNQCQGCDGHCMCDGWESEDSLCESSPPDCRPPSPRRKNKLVRSRPKGHNPEHRQHEGHRSRYRYKLNRRR